MTWTVNTEDGLHQASQDIIELLAARMPNKTNDDGKSGADAFDVANLLAYTLARCLEPIPTKVRVEITLAICSALIRCATKAEE